jgi:serine acetyltransferase
MLIVSPTVKISPLADIEDSVRDGVILRRDCVVGAGSLVRTELPPYSTNRGTPAKTMGWCT